MPEKSRLSKRFLVPAGIFVAIAVAIAGFVVSLALYPLYPPATPTPAPTKAAASDTVIRIAVEATVEAPEVDTEPMLFEVQSVSEGTFVVGEDKVISNTVGVYWSYDAIPERRMDLVSNAPFTLTLALNSKILDQDGTVIFEGVPSYRTMEQTTTYIFLGESGIGLFKEIYYEIPVETLPHGTYAEYLSLDFNVYTSTAPVFVENLGVTQPYTGVGNRWRFVSPSGVITPNDNGYARLRDVLNDWPYRMYLPLLVIQ